MTLILIKNSDDVKNLVRYTDNPNTIIVTFDFQAHKELESRSIKHKTAESYLSLDDQKRLDDFTVELTATWYKHDKLKELLEYNGMNIGYLLEIELLGYFFEQLKKTLCITRCIEKEKPSKIISSSLTDFIKKIYNDSKIEIIGYGDSTDLALFFDTIEIPIRIGSRIISLKISRKTFQSAKIFLESTVNKFFNLKPNLSRDSNKDIILLLDFNPILYENMLEEISHSGQNVILLNQRRPAIWNWKSLEVIRNTHCKIVKLNDFISSDIMVNINNDKKIIEQKLKLIEQNEEILKKVFSVEGHSFWYAIKGNFLKTVRDRFLETVDRFYLIQRLFEDMRVKCIVEWAHVGVEDKILNFVANRKKIPTILLQHGLYILNKKFEKYNEFLTLLPSQSAKAGIWGNIMYKYILDHKINKDEVLLVGSPRHDIFFKKKSNVSNNGTIIIASNVLFHNNCSGTDTKAFERLENALIKICKVANSFPGKKFIVKLHPGRAIYDVRSTIHSINPNIQIYQNENILDFIESCDCLISLNYSTILLDAMIFDKPTMCFLPEEQDFENEILFKKGATLCVKNLDDVETNLNNLISNEDIRNELINNGKEFVNDYFVNHGNASEYLARWIKNNT